MHNIWKYKGFDRVQQIVPVLGECAVETDHTHRENLFKILLNQTAIRLYLPFSDRFWNQTDFCLVPNQLENGKYNLISVWFSNISKIFLCVYSFRIWKANKVQADLLLSKSAQVNSLVKMCMENYGN